MRGDDGAPRDIIIEDLSLTGFRASGPARLAPGDEILLGLAGVGVREATVIWSRDGFIGCEFVQPISQDEMDVTITASTVVQGGFVWAQNPAEDDAADRASRGGLSDRHRLAIILAGAVVAWIVWIFAARWFFALLM